MGKKYPRPKCNKANCPVKDLKKMGRKFDPVGCVYKDLQHKGCCHHIGNKEFDSEIHRKTSGNYGEPVKPRALTWATVW